MFPSNPSVYPEFVADQLLTAHDLNELFGYLDEQGRMTRTNLIGIGIVCGLQVQVNAAQTQITITKGVGVTSQGYLISVPTITYSKSLLYDSVVKEKTYDRFVNNTSPKTKKFDVWELAQASVYPEATDLAPGFLSDKIVMLFVESLNVGNKNCDPNSCDDKGQHIEVRFVPMLVSQTNAVSLIGSSGGTITADSFAGLPEMRMRRFDVPNTNPVSSEDIFNAYKAVLTTSFISNTETVLTQAYSMFSVFVTSEFPANPFSGLTTEFAFLNNGTITVDKLQHIQYYYDLFSDFLYAYKEFRKTGMAIVSACCPDAALFPRHLLLGEAIPTGNAKSAFRHYFIYSPLFEQKNLLLDLKSLFRKLVLLRQKFMLPPVNNGSPTTSVDPNIRITPSLLEDVALSEKAIPYYYNVVSSPQQLYKFWNYDRAVLGKSHQNLSYHATQYNATDDFIINPLNYDLEPYNFLRIEGIIGKPYVSVLKNIKRVITDKRLPFDVIALNTESGKLLKGLKSLNNISSIRLNGSSGVRNEDLLGMLCHFQDLEAMYYTMKSEMMCNLCKELKYYYDLRFNFNSKPNTGAAAAAAAADMPSTVGLFNSCSPGYIVRRGTFGFLIEKVYQQVGDFGNVTAQAIAEALGIDGSFGEDADGDGIPDNLTGAASVLMGYIVTLFEIPINIIRLANTFTTNLGAFDVDEYCRLHKLLAEKANSLKFLFNMFTAAERQGLRNDAATMVNPTAPAGAPVNTTVAADTSFNNAAGTNTSTATSNTKTFTINNNSTRLALNSLALDQNNAARVLLLVFLLEDFFDHLDVLIYNCKCAAFKSLRTEYMKRLAYVTMLRQFGYFTKMHPGIQHKAGVPMGGTFIVVYHSKQKGKVPGTVEGKFTIAGSVREESGAAIPGIAVMVQGTSIGAITNADGNFTMMVYELPVILEIRVGGDVVKEVNVTTEEPLTIILGKDEDAATSPTVIDEIAEGTVIADFYLPYRCCSDCPPIQYVIHEGEKPLPGNNGPIAEAGPNETVTMPVTGINLNGSASTDPDGTITLYSWAKRSGPDAEIVTPNSAHTGVIDIEQGVYVFELTVTDDKGAIASDTVVITVNPAPAPPNQPPVANAGADMTVVLSPTNAVILKGDASADPDGTIIGFTWKQLPGGPNQSTIVSENSIQTALGNLVPGVYEYQLTVVDNLGLTGTDTVKVTVEAPPNQPPVARAGGTVTIQIPATEATLNGSQSFDPDGTIKDYAWKQTDGPPNASIVNPQSAVTLVKGLVQGTYEFTLTVRDDDGAEASDKARVIVNREGGTTTVQKTCSPFPGIMTEFGKFPGIDQNNFGRFIEFYKSYIPEIAPFFDKLGPAGANLATMTVDKQIDFFAGETIAVKNAAGATLNISVPQALDKWLSELNNIIIVRNGDTAATVANKNMFRLLSLGLYRILLQLSNYIICIQKEDFGDAKVQMNSVYKQVQGHIGEWSDNIQQFKTKELDMVGFIGDDLKTEELRVNNNGEVKPDFLSVLRKIIQVIDSIP
jgi:hypothetical protein